MDTPLKTLKYQSSSKKLTLTDFLYMYNGFNDTFKDKAENTLGIIIQSQTNKGNTCHITKEEITAAINKLNNLSAPGPDCIGALMIKSAGEYLITILTNIINESFKIGYFPKAWKQENRIYLKKLAKESYHDPKSYRSVSLTNLLGKLLERIILKRILIQLETNNFFQGKNLYSYQKFFNTSQAVLPMIEDMCEAIIIIIIIIIIIFTLFNVDK